MRKNDEVFPHFDLSPFKARLAAELDGVPHLQPITARLQRATGLPNLLAGALQAAIEISGAEFGNVQLVDESGALKIVAQRGFKEDFLNYFNEVHEGLATCGSALRQNRG